MTQVVISQAWVFPEDGHAEAYIALASQFDAYLQRQPGFRGRRLVRGLEDPTHFVHIREWDSIDDYLTMTQDPVYQQHIEQLSEHVDASRYTQGYPREFADVVVATSPSVSEE